VAKVTEKKFAAKAVRVWRLLKRVEAKRVELTKRGIAVLQKGVSVGEFKATRRNLKLVSSYFKTSAKLRNAVAALLSY